MKDFLCVAVFASTLLGLTMFVSNLRPDTIVAVQASTGSTHCKIERSRVQGCGLDTIAVASSADIGTCSRRPNLAHC